MICFLCILFSLLLLSSCTTSNDNKFKTIEATDSLSVFLGLPTSIKYFQGNLFTIDPFDKNGLIKIINIGSDSTICTFASKGEGPNEYLHIANIDPFIDSSSNKIKINIYDPITSSLGHYDFDSLICYQKDYVPTIHKLPKNNPKLHELLRIDNGYIATGIIENHKYSLLTNDLISSGNFGNYRPKPSEEISDYSNIFANFGHSVLSENRDKLIEIIYNASVISCYDVKNKRKEWEYLIKELNYHREGNISVNDEPQGYLSASFYKDKIIALYSGRKENINDVATYGNEMHVFNSDGKLLNNYIFSHDGFCLTVNPSKGQIFLLSHTPEPAIFIYDIPSELK